MKKQSPSDSVVDFKGAMIRLGGDRDLFQQFIEILKEDGPVLISKIKTAIDVADSKQVESHAHALKGLVSNFGAVECVAAALAIEKVGRDGDVGLAKKIFQPLVDHHQRLQDELIDFKEGS